MAKCENCLGSEVDRLEEKLKKQVPEATYVDIEAN
jgi:hypothetical protein